MGSTEKTERGSEGGFLLLEAVLSLVLLGLTLVAIAEMFDMGVKVHTVARERSRAVFLAQEKMEDMLSRPFGEIVTQPVEHNVDGFSVVDRTVEVRIPQGDPYVKLVTVIVAWRGRFGWSVERLETYAADTARQKEVQLTANWARKGYTRRNPSRSLRH